MSGTFGQQQFQKRQFKHKESDLKKGELNIAALKAKVALPAIGLMVTSALSLALSLGGTVAILSYGAVDSKNIENYWTAQIFGAEAVAPQSGRKSKSEKERAKQREAQTQMVVTLGIGGIIIFGLGISGLYVLTLAGGAQLKQLKSRSLVRVACIVALIPIISPLVVVGIPFGIWGLVKLQQPDIKAGFR